MNYIERTKFAMEHYMQTHPDEQTPFGRRGHFDVRIIPHAEYFQGGQWADGDETSRALDAWMYARMITGDYVTGADIEQEQWRYFTNLINKDTGLVQVIKHSEPYKKGHYYHMWDQGRALKHLAHRYVFSYKNDGEFDVKKAFDKMLDACVERSKTKTLDDGRVARFWETDTYIDDKPFDRSLDYGRENFVDFTIVCAQLLEPTVNMAIFTGEEKYLKLAKELATGFICGFEIRRGSTCPAFKENGAFYGHFHTVASGLSALIRLAKLCYQCAEQEYAKGLVNLTVKAYKWIFSEENINRGSKGGMFPEGTADEISENTEFCCTADMVELAKELAELSEEYKEYAFLDELWEDCERFTINEMYAMQILNPERFCDFVKKEDLEDFEKNIPLLKGGWAASRVWPHEMIKIRGEERIFYTIGCCLYSGQRGFYFYQKAMVKETDKQIKIRFAGDYESKLLKLKESDTELKISVFEDRRVVFRVSSYIESDSLQVYCGETPISFIKRNNVIEFDAIKGKEYKILFTKKDWISEEILGIPNDGYIVGEKLNEQCKFTFRYHGNKIVGVTPNQNVTIAFEEGL